MPKETGTGVEGNFHMDAVFRVFNGLLAHLAAYFARPKNDAIPAGWMRMVLLILYFVPFDLLTPQESFDAVSEKLFVSPVVRTLVFTKASREEVGLSENAFTDAKNFNSFPWQREFGR